MSVRIGLFVIAALLLAAHFLRAGSLPLVVLCVATPLLFLYKRRWSLIVLQVAAYVGVATWLWAAVQLVQMREQSGQSWMLAVLILGTVALLTLLAGLLMNSNCMRERYPA